MKYIYTALLIIIATTSITIASVFSNIDIYKGFLKQKSFNERTIYIESIETQDNLINTLIEAAEKSRVTLSSNMINPDQPLEVTYFVHFGNQELFNTILVTPSIDYKVFNYLDLGISNTKQSKDYRLNVIDNDHKIEFLPFHLLENNDHLGSISVSGDSVQALDLFLTNVNESDDLKIVLINDENNHRSISSLSNFMLIMFMMFTNDTMVAVLILLGILIILKTYQSQRLDTIKLINGYSVSNILSERIREWILPFVLISLIAFPLLFMLIIKDYKFILSVFRYYIEAVAVVSFLIVTLLLIMQISLILLKPVEIIKKKRNSIILPSIITLKVVLISILFVNIVPNIEKTLDLYKVVNYFTKNKEYLSDQYYIEPSDNSIDVHSLFLQKSEKYYDELKDITYISNLIEDDDSSFGKIVLANNTFVNSLQLYTIDGEIIELKNFNKEYLITRESQSELVKNRLAVSDFYCFNSINKSCSHVDVFTVDDNTIFSTLGKDLNVIKDNFVIRTGETAKTYIDYVFIASTEEEVKQLNSKLEGVFSDIPIKLVSYKDLFSEYNSYLINNFLSVFKKLLMELY